MKKKFISSSVCLLLFLMLAVLLKTVDIVPVGADNTNLGLSTLNTGVLFEYNGALALFTDVLAIIAFFSPIVFVGMGLTQLIKRKKLGKVDTEIYCIAGLYVIVAVIYLLFEKVIINYRPIIMPNCTEAEASFPSSHTMFVCTLMGSDICMAKRYIKNLSKRKSINIFCIAVAVLTVAGRLASGVHWFTDILGGVLISGALIFAFDGFLYKIKRQ